jgi:apolipoprotein N-acyltransferase
MFCDNCGTSVTPGQHFCSKCGKQLAATVNPPAPETGIPATRVPRWSGQDRIRKHTKILAVLWLAASAIRLVPVFGLWFGSGIAMHFVPFPMRAFILPLAGFIGTLLLATAVAGLLAGWGLLNYRPWARVLALVLGIISLLHVPFGTALGIYTLWVLLPAESEREYQHLAVTTQ